MKVAYFSPELLLLHELSLSLVINALEKVYTNTDLLA